MTLCLLHNRQNRVFLSIIRRLSEHVPERQHGKCGRTQNSIAKPHVTGTNLSLIMRLLTGAGTPRECAARASAWVGTILMPDGTLTAILLLTVGDQIVILIISVQADPLD
jgi:hypothetical protein